jgi:sodium transport system permease protein
VVPDDFETALVRGDVPVVEIVSDSANQRSQASTGRIEQLLGGFSRERALLSLALRGVSVQLLEPMQIEDRDLASTQTRATRITGMLPYFVMMAVLYGALNAALDTTAGERERGSLEPLLMNPAQRWAIVAGKWAAVASVSMLIAVLSCFSFLPGQWVLRSDTLAAMFQYGPHEAGLFLVVLLPLAAALAAVLMAVAIRCRTFKEAQASSTVVVLAVSLLPLVNVLDLGGDAPWHLWIPALAQSTLMTRVLKGEALGPEQVLVPIAVCVVLAALAVAFVARHLNQAAVK